MSNEKEPSGFLLIHLAAVLPAQPLDLLVGHRRDAVSVHKFPRMSRPEVVLQGPDAGREVLPRIAQPGLADVDQSAEGAAGDQDVGQAVVPMDEDVSAPCGRIGRVNAVQDLAEYA